MLSISLSKKWLKLAFRKINMKKLIVYFFLIFVFVFLLNQNVFAVCPLCTIAVGAGVGFSRWLGVDDLIAGLWIGGLIVSLIIWTENWLEKKNIRFKRRVFISVLIYYAVVIIPLYYLGIIGDTANTFYFFKWGLDKLLVGIVAGSISFWFGASWYYYLKEKNGGRAYFPFQKVVMPISPLVLLSLIFYFFD